MGLKGRDREIYMWVMRTVYKIKNIPQTMAFSEIYFKSIIGSTIGDFEIAGDAYPALTNAIIVIKIFTDSFYSGCLYVNLLKKTSTLTHNRVARHSTVIN